MFVGSTIIGSFRRRISGTVCNLGYYYCSWIVPRVSIGVNWDEELVVPVLVMCGTVWRLGSLRRCAGGDDGSDSGDWGVGIMGNVP